MYIQLQRVKTEIHTGNRQKGNIGTNKDGDTALDNAISGCHPPYVQSFHSSDNIQESRPEEYFYVDIELLLDNRSMTTLCC